jgi:serine/threonine protein kinase/tetratricopeptide (TPR) repeat protein
MNQDRWNTINRIFHAALDVDKSERLTLVAAESNGDLEIEAEVALLLQADENAGSYLESPLISDAAFSTPPQLAPGDVLCQRFRIIREIAEGGMGHVFEAFDSELAVPVALKVIRPEIAANPEAIARFRQEVRLARTITHPNICRTFDMEREIRTSNGQPSELVFLTMEFLDGETLAKRLQRDGPLTIEKALLIARQIAAALQAAHALGVVHRDMKPANIMLVSPEAASGSSPRVVVTDFGLARLDPVLLSDGLSSFTSQGHPIGTLAYMAPEQLEGTPVSPATDIYAFGLILFEMLTGKRAFPSNNLLSGIAQRLRGTVSFDQMLTPQTPANWHRAIEDCLAVNPADRPRDAGRVLAMLEEDPRRLLPRLRRSAFFSARVLPRFALWTATSLVGAALFVGGLRLYTSRAASQVSPGALIYLTQVKNQTGERAFDSLTELLQAGLSQSTQVSLLDQGRIGDTLQHMTRSPGSAIDDATAREVAMRTGAVRVIFATVTGSNGNYRLNVDIQQPDTTDPARYRDHCKQSFAWSEAAADSSATIPPELLAQVRNASDWIRHEAGESANDIARLDTPPEDVTTNSWQALAEFTSAENLQLRQQTTNAIVALRNAVRLDPHFSLAYARLGDLLASNEDYGESYQAYAQALATDQDRRLTRRERDRVRGAYAIDSRDFASAEEAYRDYTVFYDSDYSGWYYRGYPLIMLGRFDESMASLQHAYAIDPARGNAPWLLANANLYEGNLPAAMHWSDILRKQGDLGTSNFIAGVVAFLQHRYDAAELSFLAVHQSTRIEDHSWSYYLLAQLAAERGNQTQALEWLGKSIEEDRALGNTASESDHLLTASSIAFDQGKIAQAMHTLDTALNLDASPQRLILASTLLGQAIRRASAPQAALLRSHLISLEAKLPSQDYGDITQICRHRLRGEVLLAKGDASAALVEFHKAQQDDTRVAGQSYLGRVLEAAAQQQPNPELARELRLEAMDAYATIALAPANVWLNQNFAEPGSHGDRLADYLADYLRLAAATSTFTASTSSAAREFVALRKEQSHSSAELQRYLRSVPSSPHQN